MTRIGGRAARAVAVLVVLAGFNMPAGFGLPGAVAAPTPGSGAPGAGSSSFVVTNGDRELTYEVTRPGTGTAPTSGKKGSATTPTCKLAGSATYCAGDQACWFSTAPEDVFLFYPPPASPVGWAVTWCIGPTGSLTGVASRTDAPRPGTPSLQAQAARAIGTLRIPPVTAATSPPQLAIVNLETFYAPATALPAQVRGSSAFGLVAVATPLRWVVDPGDGSAVVTCAGTVTMPPPTATTAPGGCGHTYRRSSVGQSARTSDGQPGYTVSAYSVWAIRFEQGGAPVTVPGAPTTLDGPVATRILPVAEVQTIVQ